MSASATFPNFSISTTSSYVNVQRSGSGTTTVNLASINDLSGSISLSASAPSGITTSLNPGSPFSLPANGTNSSVLTVTVGSIPIGNYTVTVTGVAEDGLLVHSVSFVVAVSNFIAYQPVPFNVVFPRGGSGAVTVAVASVNGYSGAVTPVINGGIPSCVNYSFSPASFQLSPGGTGSTTLSLSSTSNCSTTSVYPSGQINSGSAGIGFTFQLNITDFGMSMSPSSLSIPKGSSRTHQSKPTL